MVSVLKSVVDWEKVRRESAKHGSIVQSLEEEISTKENLRTDESKNREDGINQFEKAKAHKSTMEAAISEVRRSLFFFFSFFGVRNKFLS